MIQEEKEKTREQLNEVLAHLGILIDLTPSKGQIYNIVEQDSNTIPIGAHIAVPFFVPSKQVAWHHGIYIGKKMVIDLSSNRHPNIQTVSLVNFFKVNDVSPIYYAIIDYDNDSAEMLELTYSRAKYLEMNPPNIEYNAWFYNCEGFATFCRSGVCRSVTIIPIFPDREPKTIK